MCHVICNNRTLFCNFPDSDVVIPFKKADCLGIIALTYLKCIAACQAEKAVTFVKTHDRIYVYNIALVTPQKVSLRQFGRYITKLGIKFYNLTSGM